MPNIIHAMEETIKVQTVQVDFKCPKCETGYLRPTGTVLTSYPPQIPHLCNNPACDYGETFRDKMYPYISHEPIDYYAYKKK